MTDSELKEISIELIYNYLNNPTYILKIKLKICLNLQLLS